MFKETYSNKCLYTQHDEERTEIVFNYPEELSNQSAPTRYQGAPVVQLEAPSSRRCVTEDWITYQDGLSLEGRPRWYGKHSLNLWVCDTSGASWKAVVYLPSPSLLRSCLFLRFPLRSLVKSVWLGLSFPFCRIGRHCYFLCQPFGNCEYPLLFKLSVFFS